MGKIGQYILGGLFVLLVVQIIIVAPKSIREHADPVVTDNEPLDQQVEQSMKDANMVETHEGAKEWEMWAKEAIRYRKSDTLTLNSVKAIFFGKEGVFFTVTGNKGTVQEKSKDMQVEGQVHIVSSNGYTFLTEHVIYNSADRKLEAPKQVDMSGPKDNLGHSLKLRGERLTADLNSSQMLVSGNVKGEKVIEGDRKVIVRSQEALFSSKTNMAQFRGEVVMDLDTMRISGPSAQFEYDSHEKMVSSISVDGGVKVTDLDKMATADRLKVNFKEDKYIFNGDPRVVQNGDELVGKEIIFLDGGRKVQVQGARARVDQKRLEKVN